MREMWEIEQEIREFVYGYFLEECDVEKEDLSDSSSIFDDLDGDSLMMIELVELLKKKYGLTVKLQSIGKYLLKHPVKTVGEVIATCCELYVKQDAILDE